MYFPTDLEQQNLFFRIGKHLIRREFIYNLKHVLSGQYTLLKNRAPPPSPPSGPFLVIERNIK